MYGICEYFTKTMSGRFEGGETVIIIPLDRQALEAVLYGTVGTYLDLTVLFLLRLYTTLYLFIGRLLRSGVLWKSLCSWVLPPFLARFISATLAKFRVLTAGLELTMHTLIKGTVSQDF